MARMIPVDGLLAIFHRMYREHWKYTWGHAEEGDVDCSGAFVYAYEQYGRSIAHGSNTIARKYVVELLPISQAEPGMAAFKYRKPGEPGYSLPDKFKPGGALYNGDLNDYYHIGLVDDGAKYALNAQGEKAGFTRTKLSVWGCVGRLKAVDYAEEVKPMQTMIVTAESGSTVRVRRSASTNSETIAQLRVGTEVQAGDDVNGWREITFGDSAGYMMSKFLVPAVEPGPYVKTLTTDEYNRLCEAREQAQKIYETLRSIVGVG